MKWCENGMRDGYDDNKWEWYKWNSFILSYIYKWMQVFGWYDS